ncbi:hypothetical protein KFK09_011607 [Dendrobium nobile]|uniref:Protein kinase domain-containing protein n=1 Tax=Dendrobium nobile TaxID=94219 RepID=A0A8T3BGB0_DENNO|nr:hypothetical protein KFK09_011607 [Dendrobium nobile]
MLADPDRPGVTKDIEYILLTDPAIVQDDVIVSTILNYFPDLKFCEEEDLFGVKGPDSFTVSGKVEEGEKGCRYSIITRRMRKDADSQLSLKRKPRHIKSDCLNLKDNPNKKKVEEKINDIELIKKTLKRRSLEKIQYSAVTKKVRKDVAQHYFVVHIVTIVLSAAARENTIDANTSRPVSLRMPHQMLLLYALLLIMLPPPEVPFTAALPPSPISDASALLSFKSAADPGGSRLSFFSAGYHSTSGQCRWPGVSCSADGRVVRLVLESLGLNGTLPNSTLGRLDQLRVLSLKSNSLSGPIPDLSALLNLKALFLGNNLLSGPFPSSLVTLHRLRTLDLSHNFLSGSIPSGLTFLDRLYFLRLDSNLLSGPVPSLNQSSLKIFNVSANDLAGPVPVTAALSTFGAAAFSGNVRLCGAVVRRECGSHLPFFQISAAAPSPAKPRQGFILPGSASATSPHRGTHRKGVMAAGFFVCAAILLILLLGVSLAVRKKKRRGMGKNVISDVGVGDGEMEVHVESTAEEVEDRCNELVAAAAMTEEKMKRLGKSGCLVFCAGEAQVYTMEQLMRASAEMLGRGSVGSTYKAVLDNRLILCVKRLDAAKIGMAGKEGFERHMEVVGRLRHPNLVPLRAFFQAKEERLLVYDYQPNGSLHSLIHGMIR